MLRDIRHALRLARQQPLFTLVAVLALALGIGANTALFSVVYAVVLKPLPYPEPERLTMVWETRPDRGGFRNVVSNANYLDWRARNRVFDAMSPVFFGTGALSGNGHPEEVRYQMVGEDYFPMLGVTPLLGSGIRAEDCRPGAPPVAVVSYQLWQRRYQGDAGLVGKTIRMGEDAVTVAGIAPPGILTISDRPPELWTAARVRGQNANGTRASGRNMAVLARLKRGVTVSQADREMVALARQLEQEHPAFNANWSARVAPLSEEMFGRVRTPLFVLLGAVGCVLLIACADVGSLLLTRAAGRERELAVRAALGATRGALLRQLLAESLTLATMSGLAGILIGRWLLLLLQATGPADLRRLDRAGLDLPVIAVTLVLTLLSGLVLGLAPAFLAWRRADSGFEQGARGTSASRRSAAWGDLFPAVEMALCLMLLAGAGILLKSFLRLTAVDPGFRKDRVLTLNLNLPGTRYEGQKGVQFLAGLNRQLRTLPGVDNASAITFLPFRGSGAGTYFWRSSLPKPAPGQEQVTDVRMVQPAYFETMRIPLRKGRTFTNADNTPEAPPRFVINETLARQMFPNQDAVGQRLTVQMKAQNPPGEIIGVVGDTLHAGLDAKVRAMVYYPQAHLFFGFATVVIATRVEPMSLAKAAAATVQRLDPQLAVAEVGTMQRWIDESVARPRFQAGLLTAFAVLALLLATLGIYGVMSHRVAQRTREIGVRMALGASRAGVTRLVLRRALRMTMLGLALGLAGALALARSLSTLVYEVQPTDPATLASVAALLLATALAASYLPARRAAGTDPMIALRSE